MTTSYFATDVHGSNIYWNKFINAGKFYKEDVIILGSDRTGKAIVPISHISSIISLAFNYVLGLGIYLGFKAYRWRKGIDIDKVYKEIPVE